MSQLITIVHTAVIVNGERVVIEPGQPLPDLGEHDSEALTKSKAALDTDLSDQAQRAASDAALRTAAEFEAERQKVIAASASTAAPAPQDPPPPAAPAPQDPPPPPAAPAPRAAVKPAGKTAGKKS